MYQISKMPKLMTILNTNTKINYFSLHTDVDPV